MCQKEIARILTKYEWLLDNRWNKVVGITRPSESKSMHNVLAKEFYLLNIFHNDNLKLHDIGCDRKEMVTANLS